LLSSKPHYAMLRICLLTHTPKVYVSGLANTHTAKQVIGLVGFSNVIWGDPLMSGGIADGNEAFFAGLGDYPVKTGGARVRMLM